MASEHEQRDPGRVVDASATKELFIEMITRDIALVPSIVDLVDNCADGARRMRGNASYQGLAARLDISASEFRLSDNCGGMSVDLARNVAFRFGRPPNTPPLKHSIGQFGVGMKRAIFKIGKYFRVESTTASSRFVIEQDVVAWAKIPEWEYEFRELEEDGRFNSTQQGTTITITELHDGVAAEFALQDFVPQLKQEIKSRLRDPIARKLAITINAIPVDSEPLTLLASKELAPAYKELRFSATGAKPVTVRLFCGLGRLILEGDKTPATGWSAEIDDVSLPAFHGQYNHLRGYAYFDCDDPGRLPWNTTKTGFNMDSSVYRAARLEMMKMALPVKTFLDRLKEEKSAKAKAGSDEPGPLQSLLLSARPGDIHKIDTRPTFDLPTAKAKKVTGPIMQKIQYDEPLKRVQEVRSALKARSWKEVGEKTFEYFYKAEVGE